MSAEATSLYGGGGGGGLSVPTSDAASPCNVGAYGTATSPSTASLSPSSGSASTSKGACRSSTGSVANLLALTELRKAAWARIYTSGISTGDAAISTTRIPSWKQFDALMIRRHRHIAVDPRDNRTLGWIACFHPYPQHACLYDDSDAPSHPTVDGREGRVAEIQIMIAAAERRRGVGTFLVKALLALLGQDTRYSTVQASFFPENKACLKLLERCGFEMAATRRNVAKMLDGPRAGDWRDLVTMELKLPPLPTLPTPAAHPDRTLSPTFELDSTIDPTAIQKRPRLE